MPALVRRARRTLRPLKRALVGPAARALDLLLRAGASRRGVVLVFHRVGDPAGDPATELVPALGTSLFERHLALLGRRFKIVPAAQLASAAAARGRFGRFPVALTFDDDWHGHASVTMPLLGRWHAPATFFLNGAALCGDGAFWFELLQSAYDTGLFAPPAAIHEHAARVQRMPASERARFASELAERLGEQAPQTGMDAQEIRALAAAGHEIGFHTRAHETLTTVRGDALAAAMQDGLAELADAAGAPVRAIAYPGGEADAAVVQAAREAGFERGYSTVPAAYAPELDPLWIGRVYPSHDSAARTLLALGRALARSAPGEPPR
jgi:peptidoglycan/xylan/chitin deacetylase (PgdA/CDA1 family)